MQKVKFYLKTSKSDLKREIFVLSVKTLSGGIVYHFLWKNRFCGKIESLKTHFQEKSLLQDFRQPQNFVFGAIFRKAGFSILQQKRFSNFWQPRIFVFRHKLRQSTKSKPCKKNTLQDSRKPQIFVLSAILEKGGCFYPDSEKTAFAGFQASRD